MIFRQRPFQRLSFSRQFTLLSFVVLVASMLIIGSWLSRQIETAVVERAAAITAMYVEGILAAQIKDQPLSGGRFTADMHAEFDEMFSSGPLRRKLVQFKLWGTDGEIIYSTDKSLVGAQFPVVGSLAAAFGGETQAKVSNLDKPENILERAQWDQLIEIYVPVRAGPGRTITTVAEFYKSVDNLSADIRTAQLRSWSMVAAANIVLFLLLIGLVRRASDTIHGQQRTLYQQMAQLRATLHDNERMHGQLGEAGRRTTALNEQFLHRVAADLHDGPAQNLALALLRLDAIEETCGDCFSRQTSDGNSFTTVHNALQSAMTELRTIAAGLRLPGIEPLTLSETAWRAVRDFENKTGRKIEAEVDESLGETALAVKITLYRLIQESLNNSLRHADCSALKVCVRNVDGKAEVEVVDTGPGFDADAVPAGHLGLACMRERVKLVSGSIEIDSVPGEGTRILAKFPLTVDEPAYV